MSIDASGRRPTTSRRRVLAGLGAATGVAGSGCVGSAESLLARDTPARASVSIKTVPTDDDPKALRIARHLAGNLESVGVRAQVVPMRYEALLRDVLMNQAFDLYVAEHPGWNDPDFLRPLLHSRFAEEAGWQNPTGYADLEVDDLLERQRRQRGEERLATLEEIQHAIVRDQPFSVVAFPDDVGAFRTDRFGGGFPPRRTAPLDYLRIERASEPATTSSSGNESGDDSAGPTMRSSTLRVALADPRPTENLNPLAAEFRDGEAITGLLYDSLGVTRAGEVLPWMADSWAWESPPQGGRRAEVTLREGLTWHDGTSLTAADVAFTYRFLADTSLGEQASPIPAPRFRGPASLVLGVDAVDRSTVRFDFPDGSGHVLARAFTVPVLPSHVWRERSGPATIAGIDTNETVTEALVANNLSPVGSGPLQVEDVSKRESLSMSRFDDHFLHRGPADERLSAYGFELDRLRFVVVPTGAAAVSLMAESDVDAITSGVELSAVPKIGRVRDVQLATTPARSFYHVGFNVRRRPLGNPRFRRAVARLLDKAHLVDDVLGGYGVPAASPLARHRALAPQLEFDGTDPELPFPGEDGVLDVERAKDAFREAGYRYSNDGSLLLN